MRISSILSTAALAALAIASAARAHIGFTGDRTLNSGNPLAAGFSATVSSRTVSSSFGWADGTDASWGDSHRNTYFRFFIGVGGPDTVDVSVARTDRAVDPAGVVTGSQTGAAGVFLPAFSLYRIGTGTMPGGTHDGATASIQYLQTRFGTTSDGLGGSGKEGSFAALEDWQIYHDTGVLNVSGFGDFRYVGHIADGTPDNYGLASGVTGDGVADGAVARTFAGLSPGEYFIVVGGADYAAQNTETATFGAGGNAFPTYGVAVTVAAIPEPSSAAALAGFGAIGFAGVRRRRRA